MNTMNEFDLQFKIFTQVDTTKSYVILNESINKLPSVSESIVLMGYAFNQTNFNDPTVKLVCICFEIAYTKNSKKTIIQRSSKGTKLFDGYKQENHNLTAILTPILMIVFYSYTP